MASRNLWAIYVYINHTAQAIQLNLDVLDIFSKSVDVASLQVVIPMSKGMHELQGSYSSQTMCRLIYPHFYPLR